MLLTGVSLAVIYTGRRNDISEKIVYNLHAILSLQIHYVYFNIVYFLSWNKVRNCPKHTDRVDIETAKQEYFYIKHIQTLGNITESELLNDIQCACRPSWEIYTPYANAAVLLLHIIMPNHDTRYEQNPPKDKWLVPYTRYANGGTNKTDKGIPIYHHSCEWGMTRN